MSQESLSGATLQRGLIQELYQSRMEAVSETDDGLTFVAKVQEADTVNQNGRMYPRAILERELLKMGENLAKRPGAVDHPEGWSAPMRSLGILWTRVWMDGNSVMAEGRTLGTQAGQDLAALIRSGVEVGISSRGFGSAKVETLDGQQVSVIQPDYELGTFDAVTDPSVYSARIRDYASLDFTALLSNEAFLEALAERLKEFPMSEPTVEDVMVGEPASLNPPAAVAQALDDGEHTILATVPLEDENPSDDAQPDEVEDSVEDHDTVTETFCAACGDLCESVWTTKYMADLPDSAYAYVKDQDGKKVRKFPYKNANGEVDKPHLRNALARLPQSSLSPDEKATVGAKLKAAAKKVGIETEDADNMDDGNESVDLTAARLERANLRLAFLKESLKSFEPVRQVLQNLAKLIADEMSEGDFCDVAMLASIADSIDHWADWEAIEATWDAEDEADMGGAISGYGDPNESIDFGPLKAAVEALVRQVNGQQVEAYVLTKTQGTKHETKLNRWLVEHCTTRAEVDQRLPEALALLDLVETSEPSPRGPVMDPKPQRQESEIEALAREGRVLRD